MKLENNKINTLEWIDIFTENKVNMGSLKRLIDSQYRDENTRNAILRSCTVNHLINYVNWLIIE